MKLALGLSITVSLQWLTSFGNMHEDHIPKRPKLVLPGKVKSSDFHRMLRFQDVNVFYSSPYSVGIEDMNQNWHNAQLAWHLLGFYVDCAYYSDDDAEDYNGQREHRENGKRHNPDHRRAQRHERDDLSQDNGHENGLKNNLYDSDRNTDGKNVQKGATRCIRKTMYAVYVDPNYQGGGVGEYRYYNESLGQYNCYSASCRAKMDCHSSNSETWKLLGIFKVDGITQSWMEQLPQNHTLGYWRWGDYYSFISAVKEKLPQGCTETKHKANGRSLYIDIKPEKHAKIDLAFYTNSICTILYRGNIDAFDVYDLTGISYSDMITFNSLLDGYKICQPCVTYSLKHNFTHSMIYNITKNHSYHIYYRNHSNPFYFGNYSLRYRYNKINQCRAFAINGLSSAATPQEISKAYRQHGMLQLGNLSYEADMISFKMFEADLPYDTMNDIPLHLQFAVLFFLGSLTFFCTSSNILSPKGGISRKFGIFVSHGSAGAVFYNLFSNQKGEGCLSSGLGRNTEHSLAVNALDAGCTSLPQPNGKTEVASRTGGTNKTPLPWREESTGAQLLSLPRQDDETIADQFCTMEGKVYALKGVHSLSEITLGGGACTGISVPTNKQKNGSSGTATRNTQLLGRKENKGALPLSYPKLESRLFDDQFSNQNSTEHSSNCVDMSKDTSLLMNTEVAESTQVSISSHKCKTEGRVDTETMNMLLGNSQSTAAPTRSVPEEKSTDDVSKNAPLTGSDGRKNVLPLATQTNKRKFVFKLLSKLDKHATFSSRGNKGTVTSH